MMKTRDGASFHMPRGITHQSECRDSQLFILGVYSHTKSARVWRHSYDASQMFGFRISPKGAKPDDVEKHVFELGLSPWVRQTVKRQFAVRW
jgi:hypothetical protein